MTATCAQWCSGGPCGAPGARPYITGLCCPSHTPAAVAGRSEAVVDPEQTLDALKKAAGRMLAYIPPPNDSSLLDEVAVKKGKRRSTTRAYSDAKRNAYDRRMRREKLT